MIKRLNVDKCVTSALSYVSGLSNTLLTSFSIRTSPKVEVTYYKGCVIILVFLQQNLLTDSRANAAIAFPTSSSCTNFDMKDLTPSTSLNRLITEVMNKTSVRRQDIQSL